MSYKFKILILFVFILVIFSLIFIDKFGLSFSYKTFDDIKKTRTENKELINGLKINGIDCAYDKSNNIFYYNVSDKYNGSKYIINLNLYNYKYILLNHKSNIIKIDYDKDIDVVIFNKKYYFKTKIVFTNLPIISINTTSKIDIDDTKATFEYINTSSKQKHFKGNIYIHTRGATSLIFEKKSYRLNFYDEKYKNKNNVLIKDFYYGSSLILFSGFRDPSKIRHNLATYLWNDMSNDYKNTDLNFKFVELFINNEYRGLYTLSEPVNRKKLGLDKDTGIIIKSTSWEILDTSDNFNDIYSDKYLGYEIKYPENEDKYNKVWSIFLNKISNYYDEDIENNYSIIKNTFNMNNYIDMQIFNAFINNVDSRMIKNLYFYMKDYESEIYIEPWDLEFSFGYTYNGRAKNNGIQIDDVHELRVPLFTSDKRINDLIIKRYKELRKTVLTEEYFDKILDKYIDELKYASKRDGSKWEEYSIEEEIESIRTWIHERIQVIDEELDKHE